MVDGGGCAWTKSFGVRFGHEDVASLAQIELGANNEARIAETSIMNGRSQRAEVGSFHYIVFQSRCLLRQDVER